MLLFCASLGIWLNRPELCEPGAFDLPRGALPVKPPRHPFGVAWRGAASANDAPSWPTAPQSHPPPETGTNPRQPRPLVARKIGADSGPSEANAQVRRGHRHSPLGASPSRTATRIASTRVWCQPIAQYESVASAHSWPAFAHLRCPVTAPAVLVGEVSPRSPPPRETVCE